MNIRISGISTGLLIASAVIFNSCKKNDAAPAVPAAAAAPVAHAHNNSPVGFGDTLKLYADTVAGAKYTWTGPNKFTSNLQNPSLAGFNKSFEGTQNQPYTVTTTVGGVTSQAYNTYVTDMEITALADSNASPNPTLPSTPNTFTTGTTILLSATSVVDIKNQIIPVTYSWTGPNGYNSNLQNPKLTVTTAAGGIYTVQTSLPATANPYNQSHSSQPVSVTVITRLAAPIKLAFSGTSSGPASVPIVGGTLFLTCQPPASAGPSDNIFNWTGPNNFSATGQSVSISNVTRAAIGTYSVSITNSITFALSVPARIYANVNYSNSGCGGLTHIYYNGILYNLVPIGNQCWFQTNLQSNTNTLFTWAQATPAGVAPGQGACPVGFHLPTDSMFQSLAASQGNNGNQLKSTGLTGTDPTRPGIKTDPNRAGNNLSNFSAILGIPAIYLKPDTDGIFWSVTDGGSPTIARYMELVSDSSSSNAIIFNNAPKTNTYNIRCLKD